MGRWMGLFILSGSLLQAAHSLPGDRLRQCPTGERVEGEYLVRYRENLVATARVTGKEPVKKIDADRIIFRSSATPASLGARVASVQEPTLSLLQNRQSADMQALLLREDVLSVEENCRARLTAITPNDTEYRLQWAHQYMNSPGAWQVSTGLRDVVVAVIDTGLDISHPDLKNNLWINLAEKNGRPGIDDDQNGYVDDVYGFNFADRVGDPSPGTALDDDHGTHVAGIIGAEGGNGFGIAGMVWKTRLMGLRVFPSGGSASMADIYTAVFYAVDNGARVINLSLGVLTSPTQADLQTYNYAFSRGVLVVVAAGNNGSDASASSPANVPGVLTVGALDGSEQLANFSNRGPLVSILAPGTGIYSTLPGATYDYISGTSMAAPFVSGAAALAWSMNPKLTKDQIRDLIVKSGRTLSSVNYPVLDPPALVEAVQKTLPAPVTSPTPAPKPTPTPTPKPSASSASPSPSPQPSPNPSSGFCVDDCSQTSAGGSIVDSGLLDENEANHPSAQMGGCSRAAAAKAGSDSSSDKAELFFLCLPLGLLGLLCRRAQKRVLDPSKDGF